MRRRLCSLAVDLGMEAVAMLVEEEGAAEVLTLPMPPSSFALAS
jgi:hypothetical protein